MQKNMQKKIYHTMRAVFDGIKIILSDIDKLRKKSLGGEERNVDQFNLCNYLKASFKDFYKSFLSELDKGIKNEDFDLSFMELHQKDLERQLEEVHSLDPKTILYLRKYLQDLKCDVDFLVANFHNFSLEDKLRMKDDIMYFKYDLFL